MWISTRCSPTWSGPSASASTASASSSPPGAIPARRATSSATSLGLTYAYAEPGPEPPHRSTPAATPASLAALDRGLAGELAEAAHTADYDRLLALLERVPADLAPLAAALEDLVVRYAYEEIADLLLTTTVPPPAPTQQPPCA